MSAPASRALALQDIATAIAIAVVAPLTSVAIGFALVVTLLR